MNVSLKSCVTRETIYESPHKEEGKDKALMIYAKNVVFSDYLIKGETPSKMTEIHMINVKIVRDASLNHSLREHLAITFSINAMHKEIVFPIVVYIIDAGRKLLLI